MPYVNQFDATVKTLDEFTNKDDLRNNENVQKKLFKELDKKKSKLQNDWSSASQ